MQIWVIQKIEIFIGSRISKFLRYDDFKLIRITCQAACHGKTEHGIFVKFKQTSKTAVVLLAGVTISGTPCPRHFTVPFGAEAPSGHLAKAWAIPPPNFCARRSVMMILNLSESLAKPLVMAKLNMAYLSSLNKRAKLLSSYLPVSPSRVLRAPGTSPYHLVPKHLRATWPRPEQSHLQIFAPGAALWWF